jgi:plastocyanin
MHFQPQNLTVKPGDRIQWVNKDLFPHTATGHNSTGAAFDSGSIAPGASWTYVVATPGEYAYACTFHPTMTARLTVR